MFEGEDGDYILLIKAATAVVIVVMILVALASIVAWFGILVLSKLLIFDGLVALIDGNNAGIGIVKIVFGGLLIIVDAIVLLKVLGMRS
jgi:hypothetical protein